MSNPEPDFITAELCLCLAFLHRPTPLRAFSQILGQREQSVRRELDHLEREGLTLRDRMNGYWIPVGDQVRARLGEMGAGKPGTCGRPLLSRGLPLLWEGKLLDGEEMIFREMENLLRSGLSAGVLCGLDILFEAFKDWRYESGDPESNVRYLVLAQAISGLSLFLSKRRRAMQTFVSTSIAVAESMGNRRMALKFRLIQVCQEIFVGGAMQGDPYAALTRILDEIHENGEENSLPSATYCLALQSFCQGNFSGCIASFRSNPPDIGSPEVKFFTGVALNLLTTSACNLGRFGEAIGGVLYRMNSLVEVGGQYMLRRCRIVAASILLQAGNPEAALELMSDAFACADTSPECMLVLLGYRNLALYHFQEKNLSASHLMLKRCLEVARKYGLVRPFQGFYPLYEILWAFHANGLPDLPDHGLEKELREAMKTPDVYRQGIALRILARKALRDGKEVGVAVRLLEDSLERLTRSGANLEIARTRLLLAECLEILDRKDEALALRQWSRSVLEHHKQFDCPPPEAGHGSRGLRKRDTAASGEALAIRCAGSFTSMPDWIPFADRVRWLIDSMSNSLEVERVALFEEKENETFSHLAARGFTPAQADRKIARAYASRMRNCLREGKITIWHTSAGAFLCLPLFVPDSGRYVFFAQSVYLQHNLTEHEPSYFEPAARVFEMELRLALRLRVSLAAVRMEEARRARFSAEQERNHEGIYYGPAMQGLLDDAEKAASTDAPIVILGETGVGKEELARRIHQISGRTGLFVPVSPVSIPEQLFESEMFGYEKGAFTDAHKQRIGLVELADKGTLFIDEAGEIPPAFQVKLLRVLQDKKFLRLGGTEIMLSDFRLISASNQDLQELVRERRFREDLYYRIAVLPLFVPPLRERPDDIRHLARMFYARYCARYSRTLPPLTDEELDLLCVQPWTGNVRELKSYIVRRVIMGKPVPLMPVMSAPTEGVRPQAQKPGPEPPANGQREKKEEEPESVFRCPDLPDMEEMQRRYISHVLARTRGKIRGPGGALEILGMKQSSLYAKIRQFGLDKESLLYGPGNE